MLMEFDEGDFVTRRSYDSDLVFKIEEIKANKALLRGYRMRLLADAPLYDLKQHERKKKLLYRHLLLESLQHLKRRKRNTVLENARGNSNSNNSKKKYRKKTGQVLHFDGDRDYLEMSLQNYKNLQLNVEGFYIPEKKQPGKILDYLKLYKPDILVITGHDGETRNNEHRTSRYFLKTVKIARDYIPDLDRLVIFAGACHSPYKSLIQEGANFAGSLDNKLLHFLDPVLIVEKIAYTSFTEIISPGEINNYTITEESVGGLETRGKMRLCFP